jgi:hypothetical protein
VGTVTRGDPVPIKLVYYNTSNRGLLLLI